MQNPHATEPNAGVNSVPSERTISALLRARGGQSPEQAAILAPGRPPLSYGQLQSQVEQAGTTLNATGLGQGDRVAVVLPNGPEMAVAFLAVGSVAACAPLNPSYGTQEFDFYLQDLDARALLIQSGLESPAQAVAQARGIPIIELLPILDAEAGLFTLLAGEANSRGGDEPGRPEDVALVLHTSGTTSRPKMVPLTHENLVGSAHNIGTAYELTIQDRCLNVMPLFHIHGLVAAILSTIAAGGSVVCTPGFDPAGFLNWIAEFQPTWYTAVPTMHQAILQQAQTNQDLIAQSHLRFVRSCSASLPPTVMAELERAFQVPALEAYGMTEAAHQMTSNPLPPAQRKPGSVGLPTGPDVAIMDEAGHLLPTGHTGEIVIRGASVTHGYVNNAEANAQAFVDGWFRTGDQGHLDDDGYLFITGRIKEIINRGGEKVSPREVDEVLLSHPAVAQAVTFALPHPTLGEDVAAAVVLQPGASATETELRELAFAHLAAFKAPSQIVIVNEIPKGPTGKLQRIGLHEKLAQVLSTEYVAPRNSVEQSLVDIWAQVLGRDQIGVQDSFFRLGGDSLRAMRLFTQVEEKFGVSGSMARFLTTPTIEQLGRIIEEAGARPGLAAEAVDTGGESREGKGPAWKRFTRKVLQVLALYAPMSFRTWLHRTRGVKLGEGVWIGAGVIIEGAYPQLVSIGDNVAMSVRCTIIAHFRTPPAQALASNQPLVRIEDDAYLGPGTIVLPNVTIGQGAVVSAGSVVSQSIPPMTMVQGNPARPVARCGVPLRGHSYEEFLRKLEPIED